MLERKCLFHRLIDKVYAALSSSKNSCKKTILIKNKRCSISQMKNQGYEQQNIADVIAKEKYYSATS
jgi:hypothetical protein